MRRFAAPVAVFVLALVPALGATSASAGRIFGDIKLDGKPLPEGLMVTIAVIPATESDKPAGAAVSADTTTTDKFGSYKLTVKPEGKCALTLVYEKQPVTLEVFSYKEATRYDLILEKKDGKLSLKRK